MLHKNENGKFFYFIGGLSLSVLAQIFWNEVPYMRVEQGTYSTESETLPLPWPALRYHSQRSLARPYAVGMLG